jgi:hypothetical protein
MNINRNNYEEYFLLYADNELTDSEKVEVIIFLKQNKDLEDEFRMIHNTISTPDTSVELADKSFLYRKNEEIFISEKNYEEVFVLYHDNELTEQQKLETEEFLFGHAQLKNEFELIGLARLTADNSIIFPDKKHLYKKEKAGKVVPIIFWRMLAAAVFIGFGLWAIQLYVQKEKQNSAVAVQSIPAKKTTPVIEKNILPDKKSANPVVQSSRQNPQSSGTEINPEKEKLQKLSKQKNSNSDARNIASVKKQKLYQENMKGHVPEKIYNEITVLNPAIKNISDEQIAAKNKIGPSPKESFGTNELTQNNIQNNNEKAEPVMHAQTAAYVPEANDNSENYVFYDITTEEFKKTKVGGFLKKVKRVIERNNPISRLLSLNDRQAVSQ